jgi:hypothetical protein
MLERHGTWGDTAPARATLAPVRVAAPRRAPQSVRAGAPAAKKVRTPTKKTKRHPDA